MKTLMLLLAAIMLSGCCYHATTPASKPRPPTPAHAGHYHHGTPWFSFSLTEALSFGGRRCPCPIEPAHYDIPSYPHYFLPDGTELKRVITDKP